MDATPIQAKQLLMRTKDGARWFGIDYNLNLYRGCSHGCIYCDSRSECYQNNDFDHIQYKEQAIDLLYKELASKPRHSVIGFGSMSDPYNPVEKELEWTKKALEVLDYYKMGAILITKSDLVVRDIPILKRIQAHSPLCVIFTITTTHDLIQKKIEPHVSTTQERLKAMKKLTEQGIHCGVLMMPIIPYINDTNENVESIVIRSKESGAFFVYPSFGITLRDRQRDYFYQMIDREFPGLKNVYMDTFGNRYSCQSPKAKDLKRTFVFECRKQKLLYGMNDIVQSIKPTKSQQLTLF